MKNGPILGPLWGWKELVWGLTQQQEENITPPPPTKKVWAAFCSKDNFYPLDFLGRFSPLSQKNPQILPLSSIKRASQREVGHSPAQIKGHSLCALEWRACQFQFEKSNKRNQWQRHVCCYWSCLQSSFSHHQKGRTDFDTVSPYYESILTYFLYF